MFKFFSNFENRFILYSLSVAYFILFFIILAFLEIKYPNNSYLISSFLVKLFILLSSSFKSDEKDSHYHRIIDDENKEHFTEDEWSTYKIIKEFRDNDVWVYEKNQRFYIDLISSDLNVAFRELSNKRYNKFSLDMESATINAFKNADNMDKNHFSRWFVGIWGEYSDSSEIDRAVTTASLKKLRDDLNSVMQEYQEKGKNIAAKHTQDFIEKLDVIIKPKSVDTPAEP